MKTSTQTHWHGCEIPDAFDAAFKPTTRYLSLRVACPVLQRKWEFRAHVWMTPRRVTFDVFIHPWDYRCQESLDFSQVGELAVRLLHPRASLWLTSSGPFVNSFRHARGLQVLNATLRTRAEQLKVST